MDIGINLSGALYGLLDTTASVDYFAAKGFSTIRLPLDWEQLQPKLGGPLDAGVMEKLHKFVSYAEAQGMNVILDLHNYGAYQGHLIGSAETPVSAFADLWGKLAGAFAGDARVSFGLMNEPQVATASQWLPAVNAAIAAIRGAGATQKVLVSGTYWDGAWSWTSSDNAAVLGAKGAIVDPAKNFVFEVHQYLDDTSGQHDWVVSETIGVERLAAITQWARDTGAKLYLGEFGVAANKMSLAALANMLDFVEKNGDVWQGAAYWAAGLGWNDYMYSVEPNLGILDMPQMAVLEDYAGSKVTSKVLANGLVELDTFVQGHATPSIKDILNDKGEIISRTIFDVQGHATRSLTKQADGQLKIDIYTTGAAAPSTTELYDAGYHLLSRSVIASDGSKVVTHYGENEWIVTGTDTYAANGQLKSVSKVTADGSHVITEYNGGVIAKVETYDASWKLVSRASYDTAGHLQTVQEMTKAGQNVVTYYDASGTVKTASYVYDAAWKQIASKTFDAAGKLQTVQTLLADGGHQTDFYSAGILAKSSVYDSAWKLLSNAVVKSDGAVTTDIYQDQRIVKSEVTDAAGHLLSRTTYDAQGKIHDILTELKDGSHQVATYGTPGASGLTTIDLFDANWQITSRTHLDGAGRTTAIDHVNADGSHTIEGFKPGFASAATVEKYDAGWHLLSRTTFDAEGKIHEVLTELKGGGHQIATYDASGAGHAATIDLFDANWQIKSRTHFDDAGRLTAIDHVNADGSHTIESFKPGSGTPAATDVYNAQWQVVSHTVNDAAGLAGGGAAPQVLTLTADGGGHRVFLLDVALNDGAFAKIADFSARTDAIELHHEDFAGLAAGSLSVDAFHVGAAATSADQRIIYDNQTGALYFDADGSGTAAHQINFATLSGQPSLNAEHFVLI